MSAACGAGERPRGLRHSKQRKTCSPGTSWRMVGPCGSHRQRISSHGRVSTSSTSASSPSGADGAAAAALWTRDSARAAAGAAAGATSGAVAAAAAAAAADVMSASWLRLRLRPQARSQLWSWLLPLPPLPPWRTKAPPDWSSWPSSWALSRRL